MVKTKTLLVIGDYKDFDTFRKIFKSKRFFANTKIAFRNMGYSDLLKNEFPSIKTKEVIVFLCFPYHYWDKYIEPKNYKGVYGNKSFYTKFKKFWGEVETKINEVYSDKIIKYINHPKNLAKDRDKDLTKKAVFKAGVVIPKNYLTRKYDHLIKIIDSGKKLFVKSQLPKHHKKDSM